MILNSMRLRGYRPSLPERGPTRFLADRAGATAVEFGILGLPFLAVICACLEGGIVYWEQEILQQAVTEAGRQIYTGKFQAASTGISDGPTLIERFRTAVCTNAAGTPRLTIFRCTDVRVSITQADTFSNASPVAPTATNAQGATDWNPSFQSYRCGGASAVMIVQAAVDVPVFFPLLGSTTASLPNRRRVLQAAAVFKVEPYTKSVCS